MPAETTRANVMRTLEEMQTTAEVNDVFVLYAARHGVIANGGGY
jgi:hypothetical protein